MARLIAASAMALFLFARPLLAEPANVENRIRTYGDWNTACDADGCFAEQDIYEPESLKAGREKATLMAQLFLRRSGDTLRVKIEGPLNTALEAQIGLLTDGTLLLLVPYQTCNNACVAASELDEPMTRTIAKAGRIEIAWAGLDGKVHYYPISTTGYADALQALEAQSGGTSNEEKMVIHPGDAEAH
jgi:invasion protein IalB